MTRSTRPSRPMLATWRASAAALTSFEWITDIEMGKPSRLGDYLLEIPADRAARRAGRRLEGISSHMPEDKSCARRARAAWIAAFRSTGACRSSAAWPKAAAADQQLDPGVETISFLRALAQALGVCTVEDAPSSAAACATRTAKARAMLGISPPVTSEHRSYDASSKAGTAGSCLAARIPRARKWP